MTSSLSMNRCNQISKESITASRNDSTNVDAKAVMMARMGLPSTKTKSMGAASKKYQSHRGNPRRRAQPLVDETERNFAGGFFSACMPSDPKVFANNEKNFEWNEYNYAFGQNKEVHQKKQIPSEINLAVNERIYVPATSVDEIDPKSRNIQDPKHNSASQTGSILSQTELLDEQTTFEPSLELTEDDVVEEGLESMKDTERTTVPNRKSAETAIVLDEDSLQKTPLEGAGLNEYKQQPPALAMTQQIHEEKNYPFGQIKSPKSVESRAHNENAEGLCIEVPPVPTKENPTTPSSSNHFTENGTQKVQPEKEITLQKTKKPLWKAAMDPQTGNIYYYHRKTRCTSWEVPSEPYIPLPSNVLNIDDICADLAESERKLNRRQGQGQGSDPDYGSKMDCCDAEEPGVSEGSATTPSLLIGQT